MKYSLNLILLLCGFIVFSCNNDESGSAKLNVLLVDDAADYKAVNVEVTGVSINYGNEGDENGWTELETNGGIYNLLDLTAGNEALLVSNEIPSGTISQVRLMLGEGNSVVDQDDVEYPLMTPSGQSSGVKLNLNESFTGGIDYTIVLDFDASRSVLDNPVKYILKPVIRASLEALNGAIEGIVDPSNSEAVIYAIQEEDTVSSTYPDEAGKFMLRGIDEGTFSISVDVPDDSMYNDLIISDVNVTTGNITDLGTLVLEEKPN